MSTKKMILTLLLTCVLTGSSFNSFGAAKPKEFDAFDLVHYDFLNKAAQDIIEKKANKLILMQQYIKANNVSVKVVLTLYSNIKKQLQKLGQNLEQPNISKLEEEALLQEKQQLLNVKNLLTKHIKQQPIYKTHLKQKTKTKLEKAEQTWKKAEYEEKESEARAAEHIFQGERTGSESEIEESSSDSESEREAKKPRLSRAELQFKKAYADGNVAKANELLFTRKISPIQAQAIAGTFMAMAPADNEIMKKRELIDNQIQQEIATSIETEGESSDSESEDESNRARLSPTARQFKQAYEKGDIKEAKRLIQTKAISPEQAEIAAQSSFSSAFSGEEIMQKRKEIEKFIRTQIRKQHGGIRFAPETKD